MTDMDLQFETADSDNPLQQNLILKRVLEHVGETDLKNCRLVSHSWNRVAVQVLELRAFAVQLNVGRVAEFSSLLLNTQLSQMNCEQPQQQQLLQLASLRLSVDLFPNNYSEHSTELAKVIQLLLLHPQLRLAFIKCIYFKAGFLAGGNSDNSGQGPTSTTTILANHELFNLLKLSSPDLTSLQFINTSNRIPSRFEDFDFDCYLELKFPKLSSLHYRVDTEEEEEEEAEEGSEMIDLTRHVVSLIRGAPKLTKLNLFLREGSDKKSTNIFRTMMGDCSAQLVELDIEYGENRGLTEVLAQFKFPSLSTFKITHGRHNFSKEFHQFLEHNCPSLRSITIERDHDHDNDEQDFTFEFPYLPHVRHFGFFPSHRSREQGYLERVHSAYVAILTKLPSLRSMSLDLDVFFMLGADFKASAQLVPPPDEYPVCLNVSILEIRIFNPPYEVPDEDELVSASQVYHHSFPNLSTLKIGLVGLLGSSALDQLDTVKSIEFLCCHHIRPGFQHLEIRNYDPVEHTWLSQMSKINKEHLKSLKLFQLPTYLHGKSTHALGIKLWKLVAQFPSLEFFQLDKEQISSREIEKVRDVSTIVGRFAKPASSRREHPAPDPLNFVD